MAHKTPFISPIIKPGSIELSVYANFYSESEKSLILAKSNSLEIFKVFKDGLSLVDVIRCEDRIKSLLAFSPRRGLPRHGSSDLQDIFYSLPDGSVHVIRYRDNQFVFFHESASNGNSTEVIDYFGSKGGLPNVYRNLECWVNVDYDNNYISLVRSDGCCRLFCLSINGGFVFRERTGGRPVSEGAPVSEGGPMSEDEAVREELAGIDGEISEEIEIDIERVETGDEMIAETVVPYTIPAELQHGTDEDGDLNYIYYDNPDQQFNEYQSFIFATPANSKPLNGVFSELMSCHIDLTNIEYVTLVTCHNRTKDNCLGIVHRSNFVQSQVSFYEVKTAATGKNKVVFKVSKRAEDGITKIIQPVLHGGFLSFNEEKIYYYSKSGKDPSLSCEYYERQETTTDEGGGTEEVVEIDANDPSHQPLQTPFRPTLITFCSLITPTTYIIGSYLGEIYTVSLTIKSNRIVNVNSTPVAVIVGTNNIIHITGDYFMTTSHISSSMLIELNTGLFDFKLFEKYLSNTASVNPYLINSYKIIYQIDNLGPILDFFIREEKDSHSNQIIACTGSGVKRINSGIKPTDISNLIKVENIQNIWSYIRDGTTVLFISCIGQTRIFSIYNTNGQLSSVELYEYASVNVNLPTVFFGVLECELPIQINEEEATIMTEEGPLIYRCEDENDKFTNADISNDNIIISTKYKLLYLAYDVVTGVLRKIDELSTGVNHEISSLSFHSSSILVSFWHYSVIKLYKITQRSTLELVSSSDLSANGTLIRSHSGNENPYQGVRSVLLRESSYNGLSNVKLQSYVGLTNGSVIIFDDILLRDGKEYTIGQRPVSFFNNDDYLFSMSDKLSLSIDSDYSFQSILSTTNPRSICKIENDLYAIAFDRGFQMIKLSDLTSLQVEETNDDDTHDDTSSTPLVVKRLRNNRALVLWGRLTDAKQAFTSIDIGKMHTIGRFELDEGVHFSTFTVCEREGTSYCVIGGEADPTNEIFYNSTQWEKYNIDESVLSTGLLAMKSGIIKQYTLDSTSGLPIASSVITIKVEGGVYSMFTTRHAVLAGIQSKVSTHASGGRALPGPVVPRYARNC